jgi:enoyl-CoA hydratase/carnithine racemase
MTMSEDLTYHKDGAIGVVQFNRPEKKNAITSWMYQAFVDALADATKDDAIRCVSVLGGDIFTAGNDIGDFLQATTTGIPGDLPVVKLLHALVDFPKPLIAGVKGPAIGIGTTMLMHCDAVVAGTSATFALPFAKLGLVPEAGSSLLFPLIAGRTRASWYLLSGEQFGATEAHDMGLVNRVVEDKDVDGAVSIMCGQLAEMPPNAMKATKKLLRARSRDAVSAAIKEELVEFMAALRSEEARSAFMKFMAKS